MFFFQLLLPNINEKKKQHKGQQNPIFMAEPMRASNSFVGTEEYIAPVWHFVMIFLIIFLNSSLIEEMHASCPYLQITNTFFF